MGSSFIIMRYLHKRNTKHFVVTYSQGRKQFYIFNFKGGHKELKYILKIKS